MLATSFFSAVVASQTKLGTKKPGALERIEVCEFLPLLWIFFAIMFGYLLGLLSLSVAVLAVVELSGRASLQNHIVGQINDIETLDVLSDMGSRGSPAIGNALIRAETAAAARAIFEQSQRRLIFLEENGTETGLYTVLSIRSRLEDNRDISTIFRLDSNAVREAILTLRDLDNIDVPITEEDLSDSEQDFSASQSSITLSRLFISMTDSFRNTPGNLGDDVRNQLWDIVRSSGMDRMPSDLILAILLISSTSVGSLYSVYRGDGRAFLKAFFGGVFAGFIAFLAVKGGRAVLLSPLN